MLVPPLFDEMNRMRKMLVDVMQALHALDISSFLPDLPGTNESLLPLEQATLAGWQQAVEACAQQHQITHIASFRAGVLTVAEMPAASHWMLSPVKGAAILRTMMRTRVAADREAGLTTSLSGLTEQAGAGPIELAGNIIGSDLFSQLNAAGIPALQNQRIVRLASDNKPGDVQIDGSALWLRAEPDDDPAMSSAIAQDIAAWMDK
ncbi:hypothetical protein [Sphingorhabdus sp. SMR4y]|uniref:hypothetical protein n=1 Tax=Sphingorhabdus sp. SMR4y TaxID=2584094 RepID=UPI000B615C73|nr:hypothetical protein [Sphingorhabdus sp. SMR4y]ASK87766.1 hydr2_PEP: exosortase A system-associated hydrolase 2 [Sphingorhabdus sp. SMR4y]